MKQSLTVLTLGVDNLEKSLQFYEAGLGWKTSGIVGGEFEHGAVFFIDLQNGLKLALFERKNLARDCGLEQTPKSATEFSLGHNVSSRQEVIEVMDLVESIGATIIKPPQETFWGGFAGYFIDIDGHLWEVVYNPELLP